MEGAMEVGEVRRRIREYVTDVLLEGNGSMLDDESSLAVSGVLDSFSAMLLVGYLEEEFGVALDPEALPAHDLGSIRAIAEAVVRLRAS